MNHGCIKIVAVMMKQVCHPMLVEREVVQQVHLEAYLSLKLKPTSQILPFGAFHLRTSNKRPTKVIQRKQHMLTLQHQHNMVPGKPEGLQAHMSEVNLFLLNPKLQRVHQKGTYEQFPWNRECGVVHGVCIRIYPIMMI